MHCTIKWSISKETYSRHIDIAGPPLHQVCYVNQNCSRNAGGWNELSSPVQNLEKNASRSKITILNDKGPHVSFLLLSYISTHLQPTLWALEEQSDASIIRVFTTAQLIFLHTCAVNWRVVQSP